jgi:hypothetical protein
MADEQYGRILSAIEYTLEQMKRGPKDRGSREGADAYEMRVELWYKHKHRFALFAIKCLKETEPHRAKAYLNELRRVRDSI